LNRLLLLEDDPDLSKTLIKYLERNGYEVDWAKNGEEAIDLSYEKNYALYLLDINVPLLNGIDLLTSLREADDHTPAIIISALVDVSSVTKGFIAGADDYLKKPFDPDELIIRIKAKTSGLKERFYIGNIEVDLQKEKVYQNGKQIYLGEVQAKLLFALIYHHPDPVPRDRLMDLLEKPTDLALRVNISKLKKHLNLPIKSIRGVGYQII